MDPSVTVQSNPVGSDRSSRELDDITLARAMRGDTSAFHKLVVTYESRIFALLSRILRPSGLEGRVEDLAQDTFVRVYRELERFDIRGPAKLSTWILTIASRLAIDELRRERVRASFRKETSMGVAHELNPITTPDRVLHRQQLGLVIERALADLSPEIRAAFVLRAYHELSYDEIASSLGCDLGTVKSRIGRARSRIRMAVEIATGEGAEP